MTSNQDGVSVGPSPQPPTTVGPVSGQRGTASRVWRAGDAEPEGVTAVRDAEADRWKRRPGGWTCRCCDVCDLRLEDAEVGDWADILACYGPLYEDLEDR